MAKPIINSFNEIAPLIVQTYERYLSTAFDDSMTMLEKVNKVIQYCNDMGIITNDAIKQWNEVYTWVMDEGLKEEVGLKLDAMVTNGTLATLINSEIIGSMGVVVRKRLTGETNDKNALVEAIEEARTTTRVVRLAPNKTYTTDTVLTFPTTTPIDLVCAGTSTIKAVALMESILYKPMGYVTSPKISGVNLDGDGLANYCYKMEQANKPIFEDCEFMNAKIAPLAIGTPTGEGSLVYEARFRGFKITGIDSGKFTASSLPSYGIHAMKGSTDNHFDDIVIRNIKLAGVRDEGSNNVYGKVHIFGYPEPAYIPDYGLDLANGRAIVTHGFFADGIRLAGIKMRGSFSQIIGALFYWRFDTNSDQPGGWDKSGACGIEIDSGVDNYIIMGNSFRGLVGTDIRYLGFKSGTVLGNSSVSVIAPTPYHVYGNRDVNFGNKIFAEKGFEVKTLGATIIGQSKFVQENVGDSEYKVELLGSNNSKYVTLALGAEGIPRWKIQKDNTVETGLNNVGSDFKLVAVRDDGTDYTGLRIKRTNRDMSIYGDLLFETAFKGSVLLAPDGTKWRIKVANGGALSTEQVL